MKTILILTHARDDCADLVVKRLTDGCYPFVRFNTEEFQRVVKLTMHMDSMGHFQGKYVFPDKVLSFEQIGAVWNRRVHEPDLGPELDGEPELKEWVKEETIWALNISFMMLSCPVVNPWEINERLRFNKVIQMQRAASLGLEIPLTCITNELGEIETFWNETEKEMIFKKIRRALFHFSNGRRMLVHTSKIPPDKFTPENLQRMRFCPMFFQAHIPKRYDVRSVVVGEKVFSTAIHSQGVPEGKTDYRTAAVLGKLLLMKHETIDLGETVNKKLTSYTKSFGLSFSVIDLILTPDDRLVFLEDNPNGQWGWLEHITGAPISGAFADYLVELATKRESSYP